MSEQKVEEKSTVRVSADSYENDVSDSVENPKASVDEPLDDANIFVIDRAGKYPDITEEEEKKAVRKNDYILLPMLFLTCTFGAVDKVSLGTAALYELRETANLSTDQYSWLGSVIFIGSLFGVWPMSYLTSKFALGKVLAICSTFWSMLTLLLAACNSFVPLLVIRFLMGVFESAIVPGATLTISRFYLKKEQPVRLAIIFAFGSSFINGFLSWLVGYFGNEIPRWKYLFLMVGSISFSWSLLMLYFLPSSSMNAHYLNDRERYILTRRVLANKTGVQTNEFKWYQAFEAILDIKTYIIFLFNIGINIPNGGLGTFSGIIISQLGFDAKESSLMTIPTGFVASASSIFFNYLCGKFTQRRCLLAVISLIIPVIGAAISYAVPEHAVGPRLLGLYFMYFYFSPYVIMISLSQVNTAGSSGKRSTVTCLTYLGYCVGALSGAKTFDGGFTGGFTAMLCAYCACMVLALVYWVVTFFQNKRKWKLIESDPALLAQFEEEKTLAPDSKVLLDKTDKEQKTFLYTT